MIYKDLIIISSNPWSSQTSKVET